MLPGTKQGVATETTLKSFTFVTPSGVNGWSWPQGSSPAPEPRPLGLRAVLARFPEISASGAKENGPGSFEPRPSGGKRAVSLSRLQGAAGELLPRGRRLGD